MRLGVLVSALGLILWPPVGFAQETVCAEVKIEIEQQVTLERQAFDAHMKVVNGLESVPLENVQVDVRFADAEGNTVEATSDPNDDSAAFFIRVDRLENVDSVDGGTIEGGAEANMHWLIVPSPGAAEASPEGTLYFVGAKLSYTYGGETEEVEVAPDRIRVDPMPELALDYFLPRNVDADDPLTDPIESPIPFTLGVRVNNAGDGPARELQIESAQPEIVDNEQGLPIDFRIIDTRVGREPRANNLTLDFGTINPAAARIGRWRMKTTFSGRFTDFDASFTHADRFGGELTSVIDAVRTHRLVGDVLVDADGRDRVRDFLANPADLRVFESNGNNASVTDHSDVANVSVAQQSGDWAVVEVELPQTAGFGYASVIDPLDGDYRVDKAVRVDGKRLPEVNAWAQTVYESGGDRSHDLHVFDHDTPGQYKLYMQRIASDPGDPVIRFIPDKETHEGSQVGFLVESGDRAGNEPSLSMGGPGLGETFTDNGDGTGEFHWSPQAGDAGTYTVTFTATRGDATTQRSVEIQVNPAGDIDGDGLPDDWEREHFGDLSRDGTGDYSGDGISDRLAYERGLDPTQQYNSDDMRVAAGTVIADGDWSDLPRHDVFDAPVVITGPARFNDPASGAIQLAPRVGEQGLRLRFREWPGQDGEHGPEQVSYVEAEPGLYLVDGEQGQTTYRVGTVEIDAAGEWQRVDFGGGMGAVPRVLVNIQRDADLAQTLTARIERVDDTGFRVGVFGPEAAAGESVDVTVGYIAVAGPDTGVLPRLDADASYQAFTESIAGEAVTIGDTRLRRQRTGSAGGTTEASAAEPVAGLRFDGHVLAQSQAASAAEAATLRQGPRGGRRATVNFAAPSTVVAAGDGQATLEVVRNYNLSESTSVALTTRERTAVAGRDFVAVDRELSFAADERLKRVTVDLVGEGNTTPSQALDIHLRELDGGARVGKPGQTLVTVVEGATDDQDNDGMADDWERHYFGGIDARSGSGDANDDGRNDRRSFLEGLDPTAQRTTSDGLHWQRRAIVDASWSSVALPEVSDQAVVVAGVPSRYGNAAGTVRLRREAGEVQARFARWSGGGDHGLETLALLAAEPGAHTVGRDTWRAGRVADLAPGAWQTVTFDEAFDQAPRVLASAQSANADTAVAVRVRNVTADGFDVRLAPDDHGGAETVGYIALGGAVAQGQATIDGASLDYRLGKIAVDTQASGFAGQRLALEPGDDSSSWAVEVVDALALGGRLFAQPISWAQSGPVAGRRPVLTDADADGLDDRYELAHGLDTRDFADATRDPDGDGASTLAEVVAGTDARSADETPAAARMALSESALISAWPTTVDWGRDYDAPVVIVGAASDYEADPGVVRLSHVGDDRVRAEFQEWSYLDGAHGRERAPLLALERGRHLVDDSQVWEAGTASAPGGERWRRVTFDQPHDEIPRVLVTPQSHENDRAVVARVRNVTREGFEVAVFGERAADSQTTRSETVGYLATSVLERRGADAQGAATVYGKSKRVRLEREAIDDTATEIGRSALRMQSETSNSGDTSRSKETVAIVRFDEALFGQDVTYNDATPATVRRVSADGDYLEPGEVFFMRHGLDPDVDGLLQLDASGDGFSIREEWIAGTDIFSSSDQPVRAKVRTRAHSLGDAWSQISFARYYQDPVVIAGAASADDPAPGVVELEDVHANGVRARFAEWAYLDGAHPPESVPLMVIDAGRHLVDGDHLWEAGSLEVDGVGEWHRVEFDRAHESVPRVLVTRQTANGSAPVTARVRDVTESGFEVALFAEQARDASDHPAERVGFVAISGASSDGHIDYGGTKHAFAHGRAQVDDSATPVEGFELRLQAEESVGNEAAHDTEGFDYLLFDGGMFGQPVTFNDAHPAVLRRAAGTD
jgi:hypothetical protein